MERVGIISMLLNNDFFYRSFVKDSLKFLLEKLLFHNNSLEAQYSRTMLMSCILIFENEDERDQFEHFVYASYNKYDIEKYKDDIPFIENIKGYNCETFRYDYKNALLLRDMLDEFRIENKN